MRKEEKDIIIDGIAEQLRSYAHFYITDISTLNSAKTSKLRKTCYENDINLIVVKNTLLYKALVKAEFGELDNLPKLQGPSAIMFTHTANAPAKLIKEFRKSEKSEKPLLKAAYAQECLFVGEQTLDELVNIKSREELIGQIVDLLQSPARNVISALQSGGQTIAGLVKTLSERPE